MKSCTYQVNVTVFKTEQSRNFTELKCSCSSVVIALHYQHKGSVGFNSQVTHILIKMKRLKATIDEV